MTDPNQQPPKDVADAALDEVVGGDVGEGAGI